MTPTLSSTPPLRRRSARRELDPAPQGGRTRRRRRVETDRQPLGRYIDLQGRTREVHARAGSAGSVLVVDRDAVSGGDRRLVAHLASDEPAENAVLVWEQYVKDVAGKASCCRHVTADDARTAPHSNSAEGESYLASIAASEEPTDSLGCVYRLELLPSGMSIPELRWRRYRPKLPHGTLEPVSVRDAIASIEDYEPVRALTLRAARSRLDDDTVSTTVLRSELKRMLESPIVLNRRLREVVLATSAQQQLSMSEIALRCGRVKRDSKGNESGETSWLARRLGLLPEAGRCAPTPWIHSDVLGLIARSGLGMAPREVELT